MTPTVSQKVLNLLDKHVDKTIKSYFCSECYKDHKRYVRKKFSLKFFDHLEHKLDLTPSQRFNVDFKKNWRNEAKKRGIKQK